MITNRAKRTKELIKRRQEEYRKAIKEWKEKLRKNPNHDSGPKIKKYG